jgi:hypothetical protein
MSLTLGLIAHVNLAGAITRSSHPIDVEASMKAIAGISSKHMALLDEYRMALSLWSETRALYLPEAMEIMQATKHLEDLEYELVERSFGTIPRPR